MIKIAFGCDHAGFPLKAIIMDYLRAHPDQYGVIDFGTDSAASVDYPDFVHPAMRALQAGVADLAILVCGSGNGVAITANKYQHVRAALCWNPELAQLARQHNNANVLCLGARFIHPELALSITEQFLISAFEGGRHQRRVDKISVC